jgi:hypothetical protein
MRPISPRAASSLPPALSPLTVVLAAEPARKSVVVPGIAARDAYFGRGPAHCEAALWLVMQCHHKLRAIVSLAVQRLVRDDERGSRQCGGRDAIEHIFWNADTVERGLRLLVWICSPESRGGDNPNAMSRGGGT